MEERSRHELKHGEAVAIDMAVSSLLAAKLGLLPERDLMQILRAYERMRLPATSRWSSIAALEEGMEDSVRHRGGSLNLVLPIGIGSAAFVEDRGAVSERALRKALARSWTLSTEPRWRGASLSDVHDHDPELMNSMILDTVPSARRVHRRISGGDDHDLIVDRHCSLTLDHHVDLRSVR